MSSTVCWERLCLSQVRRYWLKDDLCRLQISPARTELFPLIYHLKHFNMTSSSLAGASAGCALFTTWEALIVGIVGGLISVFAMPLFDKMHIDDPVGATSVHGESSY